MLARREAQNLDLDNLKLEVSNVPNATTGEWVTSEEAFSKAKTAKRNQFTKASIKTDYKALCTMLKLPLKRFQIFEVEDKQRLSLLQAQFEKWVNETGVNLEHMIPTVLFWQQFEFASISPSNFNVEAITESTNTFKEMPLFQAENIFYLKGGDLGHLLFDDDTKNLNVYTGNEKKFQFHLLESNLNPFFIKFLESK